MKTFAGLIAPPQRTGRVAAGIVFINVAINAALPFLAKFSSLPMMTGAGLLLIFSLFRREFTAIHVTIFTFLFTVWGKSSIWPPFWPFFLLGPLAIYALVVTGYTKFASKCWLAANWKA